MLHLASPDGVCHATPDGEAELEIVHWQVQQVPVLLSD